MRKSSWIVIGLAAFALAVGCTISDDDEDPGPANGGSGGGGYSPDPNGVAIGEQEACEILRDAFDEHAGRLGCTYTLPDCPSYIRQSGAPVCSEYDEGTVTGCADFYATFTSCSEFQARPCEINNIEGSAPAGCDEEDAGTDAEADAEVDAEVEAGTDAEVEAGTDAEVDAEVEAGTDAEVDAEVDAGDPDAAVDAGAADATTD